MRAHAFPTRTHLRVLSACGLVLAAAVPAHSLDETPTICPFRLATGLPCPACGLTRSVVFAMHGDAPASLDLHPFGVVTVVLMVALAFGLDRRFPAVTAAIMRRSTLAVIAAIWIGSWIARLATAPA